MKNTGTENKPIRISPQERRGGSAHRLGFVSAHLLLAGLALILALSGCGDLSLEMLLKGQNPGELGITPSTATIFEGSTIEIAGHGGFSPYTYSITGGGSINELADGTYYTAPSSVTTVTIVVRDRFSTEATATYNVVSPPPGLSFPPAMTIEVGENTGYVIATGGTPPYTFWLVGDGTLTFHPVQDDRVRYAGTTVGTAEVWVEDSLGAQRTMIVTIEDD